ncbi:hypothetical protein HHK36_014760 [Tetracentron sinense]|uniref:BZIP domain-containing protein n=1 Tax=Tetracentron sinense TaxID=13715 RepID=A0A835DD76_TETSI|nr:hypothetical protein HHK36_014760 [Tetracentron sinense]
MKTTYVLRSSSGTCGPNFIVKSGISMANGHKSVHFDTRFRFSNGWIKMFQLEKMMKILPHGLDEEESDIEQVLAEDMRPNGEILHKYATIRSKEAVTIIEKHTEALFGGLRLQPHLGNRCFVVAASGGELEGKSGEGKSKTPLKRSKGSLSLSMLTGKSNEMEKASGASANSGLSQSGESGSEGSSEGSDATSQNSASLIDQTEYVLCWYKVHKNCLIKISQGSQEKPCGKQGSVDTVAQNVTTVCSISSGVTQIPSTQAMLNQRPAPSSAATTLAKLSVVPATAAMVTSSLMGSHDGISTEHWIKDERELKRQRRKQSNRESARRSQLRKQAECEELVQHMEILKGENSSLREELERTREECEKLAAENASLTVKTGILEEMMKILPHGLDEEESDIEQVLAEDMRPNGEILQKYATIRSKEAVTIIEKHTEALFGGLRL